MAVVARPAALVCGGRSRRPRPRRGAAAGTAAGPGPAAMRVGDWQRRARLPALDLAQHRGRYAGALGEVAQRQVRRLAQRADAAGREAAQRSSSVVRTLSHTVVPCAACRDRSRRCRTCSCWARAERSGSPGCAGSSPASRRRPASTCAAASTSSARRPARSWRRTSRPGKRVEDPGVVHDARRRAAGQADEPPGALRQAARQRRPAWRRPRRRRSSRWRCARPARPAQLARAAILRTARAERPRDLTLGPYLEALGHLRRAAASRDGRPRDAASACVRRARDAQTPASPRRCSRSLLGAVDVRSRGDRRPRVRRRRRVEHVQPRRGAGAAARPRCSRCCRPSAAAAGAARPALLRAAGQAAGLAELQVLRARGVRTRIVAPDAATIEAMGSNLMDPGPRREVYAAGRAQGRALGED